MKSINPATLGRMSAHQSRVTIAWNNFWGDHDALVAAVGHDVLTDDQRRQLNGSEDAGKFPPHGILTELRRTHHRTICVNAGV